MGKGRNKKRGKKEIKKEKRLWKKERGQKKKERGKQGKQIIVIYTDHEFLGYGAFY
jgi:hypothetical protein